MSETPDLNSPIVVASQEVTPPYTPRLRRTDLATLKDVRRELGRVYRDMRKGRLACQDGTRYTYVLKAIADLIAQSDLEARLEALERLQLGKGRGYGNN